MGEVILIFFRKKLKIFFFNFKIFIANIVKGIIESLASLHISLAGISADACIYRVDEAQSREGALEIICACFQALWRVASDHFHILWAHTELFLFVQITYCPKHTLPQINQHLFIYLIFRTNNVCNLIKHNLKKNCCNNRKWCRGWDQYYQ